MSRYTEYVVWQSRNSSWNIGIYSSYSTGDYSDPDYDEEWDREYVYDSFDWVSLGHASETEARNKLTVNPGHGGDVLFYNENPEQAETYMLMALALTDPKKAEQLAQAEAVKKASAKQAKVVAQLKANSAEGKFATVILGGTVGAVATGLGMFTNKSGYVSKQDGWLTVDGVKFYNPETEELNQLVSAVRI